MPLSRTCLQLNRRASSIPLCLQRLCCIRVAAAQTYVGGLPLTIARAHSYVKQPRALVAAASLVAICAVGLLLRFALITRPDFVLVVDSGSTGTRIYAYTWQERRGQLPALTLVDVQRASSKVPRRAVGDKRAYERVETEPGLDHFLSDAAGLRSKALGPLLDWAAAVVPSRQHADTPLFLFGTAGLRKLPTVNQTRLMADVQDVLLASPFRFQREWARVISGMDEGIFGWVAVNYLTGHLAPTPLTAPKAPQHASSSGAAHAVHFGGRTSAVEHGLQTVGALDLGGSSLEVTFVPADTPQREAQVNVTIMGVQYVLYSHVHHHYGLNDAFDRSVSLLLRDAASRPSSGSSTPAHRTHHRRRLTQELEAVYHPCLHLHYNRSYERGGAALKPRHVQLLGRPDWPGCEALAVRVVQPDAPCPQPPCALGAPQPVSRTTFYALTGFYVVYHWFGLPPSASLAQLRAAGRRFCERAWPDVERERGAEMHADRYCFRAPYVASLLRDGLNLPDSQVHIGSGREAWTLGAALAEGSRIRAALGVGQPATRGKVQTALTGSLGRTPLHQPLAHRLVQAMQHAALLAAGLAAVITLAWLAASAAQAPALTRLLTGRLPAPAGSPPPLVMQPVTTAFASSVSMVRQSSDVSFADSPSESSGSQGLQGRTGSMPASVFLANGHGSNALRRGYSSQQLATGFTRKRSPSSERLTHIAG